MDEGEFSVAVLGNDGIDVALYARQNWLLAGRSGVARDESGWRAVAIDIANPHKKRIYAHYRSIAPLRRTWQDGDEIPAIVPDVDAVVNDEDGIVVGGEDPLQVFPVLQSDAGIVTGEQSVVKESPLWVK